MIRSKTQLTNAQHRTNRLVKTHHRLSCRHIITNVGAVIFCIVWLFPVYWMIITAFKPRSQVLTREPVFWPSQFSLENFITAIFKTTFFPNLRNSVFVTVISIVVSIMFAFLASAALTLYRFRGRRVIMIVILALQMIPVTALLIPQFIVFNNLGLINTYAGLILAFIASALPFAIWNLRGFFLSIPVSIFESARVEGASEWQLMWNVVFPLVAPGIVSTSVFAFNTAWNNYLTAFTFLKDSSKYTLPVWLAGFSTPQGTDFGGQMAASVIFSLPVVVFFMIVQHNIAKGITSGSVK